MATLLLIRHAETAGNLMGADAVMSGWTDLPLTEHGLSQARDLGARLVHEPAPAAIYSSTLTRARDTAAILGAHLGQRAVRLERALCEIGCGSVDGWPIRQVQQAYPREWAQNESQSDPEFRWPGGESYREFRERVVAALKRIAAHHDSTRVLVVTHAGVISQVVGWVKGESPARWELFRPRNTSITEMRWHAGQAELVSFDERGAPNSSNAGMR
jgi:2,3-bisphosphoglycerate-dependent phosphoglycerate mutase